MKIRILTTLILLLGSVIYSTAQMVPVVPDTIYAGPPVKDVGPDDKSNIPGKYPTIEVAVYNGQMLLHFSQPVSCEIQLVDLQGQPQIIARMREEDFAVLDVSRLHGRFQLVIFSDHWFATKPYWFP